jgi:serine/threonine protein kinase
VHFKAAFAVDADEEGPEKGDAPEGSNGSGRGSSGSSNGSSRVSGSSDGGGSSNGGRRLSGAARASGAWRPLLVPPPWRHAPCGFVGIVTELCAEGSLDALLRRASSPRAGAPAQPPTAGFPASPQEGPPWAARLRWGRELASALAFLHEHDILHRDVKVGFEQAH